MILDETSKSFPKYNATGRSLPISFNSPVEEQNPGTYLKECIIELTNYLVDEVPARDLLKLRIRNTENVEAKVVGISLRRLEQLNPDLAWTVIGKVIQSNTRFGLRDRLEVHLEHVSKPGCKGRIGTKGRSLDVMNAIQKSIVTVKALLNCLAYALIIAMARVNSEQKYQTYRDGKGLKTVEDLLKSSGLDLSNGGSIKIFGNFKITIRYTKLLCLKVLLPIGTCLAENHIRPSDYT